MLVALSLLRLLKVMTDVDLARRLSPLHYSSRAITESDFWSRLQGGEFRDERRDGCPFP